MGASLYYKPLANQPRIKTPTPGGLCGIRFAPVEWVYSIPAVTVATSILDNVGGIILTNPHQWLNALAAFRKGISSTQRADDAGSVIETTISCFLPFDSIPAHLNLDALKNRRFIVLADKPEGHALLVGSLDNPARIIISKDTGQTRNDTTGTSISFVWISEDLPLIYKP